MKPRNNPKNVQGFIDYQRRQLELARQTEKDARQRRIESNLEKWIHSLPSELRNATPNRLPKSVIEKVKNTYLKPPYEKFTIISSEDLASSRFVSYSIIHALLKGGIITPSEIKTTDIMDGYKHINGMFNSRQWKEYFFDNNAKVLLIEGSSKSLALLGSKGEDQFWREILEFTKNNDKLVIITYSTNEEEQVKDVLVPFLTSDKDLNFRVLKKSSFVRMNRSEEREMN